MSVEQFTVQPPLGLGLFPLIGLVVTGIVFIVLAFATGRRAKTVRGAFVILLIIGLAVIGLGVWLFFSSTGSSTITVGSGYVSIASSSFSGTGNQNYTSSEIASACGGQIGSGNLTLSKQHGTKYGDFNVGVFTLGNGATAYVVSNNSTDLIVYLDSNNYLIIKTSNTNTLLKSFPSQSTQYRPAPENLATPQFSAFFHKNDGSAKSRKHLSGSRKKQKLSKGYHA